MTKPAWLTIRPKANATLPKVQDALMKNGMSTVCEEAHCPNRHECWSSGTATFLIFGQVCTRACRFCTVSSGEPQPLDASEPERVALAAREMGLGYVVLTSVDRDDLPDQGARHFAECIRAVHSRGMKVEALIPDFCGESSLIKAVVAAQPEVLGHNLETVRRLTPLVRDRRASYEQSLAVLRHAKALDKELVTKSSLLLGIGENRSEVLDAMDDLLAAGVSVLTLGQYLQPSARHLPVERYLPPEEFAQLRAIGLDKGFLSVSSGPLVRSSYRAAETSLGPSDQKGF